MSEGGKKDPFSAGKGDTPRPINLKRFRDNWDAIDWGKPKVPAIPSQEEALERYIKSKEWQKTEQERERRKAFDEMSRRIQQAGHY